MALLLDGRRVGKERFPPGPGFSKESAEFFINSNLQNKKVQFLINY